MNQIGLVEGAGIVIVLALIAWQVVFFQFVRPRIMARIGRRLNVGVQESVGAWDAGVYDAQEGAPLRKGLSVIVADFIVIMVGVPGVLGGAAIALFLLAESGLPSRWEGQLTGTSILIGEIVVPPMIDRKSSARVTVRNDSRVTMPACRLDLTGYTARNGYLNGASNYFDLAPATSETVDLKLEVMKPVPGMHRFRINLECGERLKDSATATVDVGE